MVDQVSEPQEVASMWKRIATRRYTRTLAALSAGDVEAVLEQFAPDVRFVFVGDSSLGTELGSKEDVRRIASTRQAPPERTVTR